MKGYEALKAVREVDDRFLDEAVEWNNNREKRRPGVGKRVGLIAAALVAVIALTGAGLRIIEPELYARWVMNLTDGAATENEAVEWVKEMLAGPREVIHEDETFRIESLGVVRSSQTFLFSLLITVKDGELVQDWEDNIYTLSPVIYPIEFYRNGQRSEVSGWGGYGTSYSHDNMPPLAENEFLCTEIYTVETEAVFDQFSAGIHQILIEAIDRQTMTDVGRTEIPMDSVDWTCELGGSDEIPSLLLEFDSYVMEDGKSYHLNRICITPFNILVYTDTDAAMFDGSSDQYCPSLNSLSVVKEDGTEAAALLQGEYSRSWSDQEKTTFAATRTFSVPIRPDEITGISLDGQIIWEKSR